MQPAGAPLVSVVPPGPKLALNEPGNGYCYGRSSVVCVLVTLEIEMHVD